MIVSSLPRTAWSRIAALLFICAGASWLIKAGSILLMDAQPVWLLEGGLLCVAGGVLALLRALAPEPSRGSTLGLISAAVALISWGGLVLGRILPGIELPAADAFVMPWSLYYLLTVTGAFLSLVSGGIAMRNSPRAAAPWKSVPLPAALAPLPLALTGALHVEAPILATGLVWMLLGFAIEASFSRSRVA